MTIEFFPMHDWMMAAFERQKHPVELGAFRIVRERNNEIFDGKLFVEDEKQEIYVRGWLQGRQSVLEERDV